jgi:hypothetical protein
MYLYLNRVSNIGNAQNATIIILDALNAASQTTEAKALVKK